MTPPARPKMVAVTLLAVYPLSLLFPLVVVPALTYAFNPGLSRVMRRWLYPAQRTDRQDAAA
ncbi:hypothetical protein [Actinomadura sp. DC4]|uniref:hypothetical protein n=1 Tax=Actinomadura sp. DC4 TaxID=3055069 RepID=UPI0025B2702A|nr:hypothetical protein [Actinomadura sp. DC4]MDN3359326.1 hypothetical protein [Actinomadura sp. DC4]